MAHYPALVREIEIAGAQLASALTIPHAKLAHEDGLYVRAHRVRDPVNVNRHYTKVKVRVKRDSVVIFESVEERRTFPTDHLIAQLALIT